MQRTLSDDILLLQWQVEFGKQKCFWDLRWEQFYYVDENLFKLFTEWHLILNFKVSEFWSSPESPSSPSVSLSKKKIQWLCQKLRDERAALWLSESHNFVPVWMIKELINQHDVRHGFVLRVIFYRSESIVVLPAAFLRNRSKKETKYVMSVIIGASDQWPLVTSWC